MVPEALVVREIRSLAAKITGEGKLSLKADSVVVKTIERKGALPGLVRVTTKAASEDVSTAVRTDSFAGGWCPENGIGLGSRKCIIQDGI